MHRQGSSAVDRVKIDRLPEVRRAAGRSLSKSQDHPNFLAGQAFLGPSSQKLPDGPCSHSRWAAVPASRRYTASMTPTRSSNSDGPSGLTYADSGVDIEAGDRAVAMMQAAVRRTHGPRVMGLPGGFAGMFRLDFNEKLFKRNYLDPVMVACTDGVGTKVKLAADLGTFHTVGIDCVAMNVNDMIVQGAEPLFFLDYLGLHRQDPEVTSRIVEGVAHGCELAGCALLGGECAEMPDIYAPGDFDIAGFAVGVVELSRAIDPLRVKPDDVLIGLASSGVHSNHGRLW